MPPDLLVTDQPDPRQALPVGAMSALDYLRGGGADLPAGTRVRNLAQDYAYLSRAYYVSLLAEARGHVPFPHVADLLSRPQGGHAWLFPEPSAAGAVRPSRPVARKGQGSARRLGVLFTPADRFRASSRASMMEFARAASSAGLQVELIGRSQIGKALDGLAGLFIRDLPQPGNYAFRAALQAEALGLPVIDDAASIARCENKAFIHHLLERHGVPTPDTLLVTPDISIEDIVRRLGLPVVLKTPDGSFSVGVHKAQTAAEGARILTHLRARSAVVVAQEYMPTDYDWRIGVLGGEPLFACKYFMARGHWQIIQHLSSDAAVEGEFAAVPLDEVPASVIDTARRAANLVGGGLYGVDLKQQGSRVCVIEVNANPDIDAECEAAVPASRVWPRLAEWFAQRMPAEERSPAAATHRRAS